MKKRYFLCQITDLLRKKVKKCSESLKKILKCVLTEKKN